MANEGTKVGSIYYEATIDPSGVKSGAGEITSSLDKLKGTFNSLNPTVRALGVSLGAYIGGRAVIDFFKGTIDAANESNRVLAQTEAVLSSTGNVAGYTGEQIHTMAAEIQNNTTISDEAAQSGINMLLTFTNIRSQLPGATQALMDMATAMNGGITPSAQELTETAKQLGKWLQNPADQMAMAIRVGVNFTDQQKALARQLQDTGDMAGAQKIVIDELAKEFGGSAAAQAQTFQGRIQQLKNSFNDVQESIGNTVQYGLLYLIDAFGTIPQVANGVITAFKYVIAIMMTAVYVAQTLGMAIGALFGGIVGTIQGGIGEGVQVFKAGMVDMAANAAKYQKSVSDLVLGSNQKQGASYANMFQKEADGSGAKTSKIKKDLADETAAYQDALAKRNKSFDQSMADLIWAHQDKVNSLKKQLSDENNSFDNKMADQVKTFKEAMDQMQQDHEKTIAGFNKDLDTETSDHEKKVETIQAQIDQENSYGKNARQSKLAELKQELQDENDSYAQKVADIQAKIDEENQSYTDSVAKKQEANMQETADLQATHNQQVTDLQTQLSTEQGILSAHQGEVDAIKDKARVDDITRLQQQHADENTEAEKQHIKRMADIVASGSSEGAAGGGAFMNAMDTKMKDTKKVIDDATKSMGTTMVNNISEGAKQAGEKLVKDFVNSLIQKAKDAVVNFVKNGIEKGNPLTGGLFNLSSLPFLASGTSNFGGGLAMVGENGPELVNLPSGSQVYSNDASKKMAGQVININVERIDSQLDIESIAREIGFRAGIQPS